LRSARKDVLGLLLLTAAALFVHGYHPYSEDAETYLPGIEKVLHPHLFPVGAEYFQLHAHLTLFPQLIAYSVRVLHLSLPWVLFLWQMTFFFLFLLACWELMQRVFPGIHARWAGVALIAALFTMPVAGAALYVMDPFLNPRNVIAFAEIFCVVRILERKYLQAALFIVFAVSIHPLMSAFSLSFCLLLAWSDRRTPEREVGEREAVEEEVVVARAATLALPVQKLFDAPTKAYDTVASTHRYQFLARWTWYEILGAVAPLIIFEWFGRMAKARGLRNLELLCRAMVIYGAAYFAAGLIVSVPHRLEVLSLLQPMRSLHLLYVLMLLFMGGFLGEYVLKNRVWVWLLLFVPLCAGMYAAQRTLYPASTHIEWPAAQPRNPWAQAFAWVRDHTPEQAIFALDPLYMHIDGEDANGFRAVAERSQLADGGKDSGVVEMFPQIGDSWMSQVQAQTGIDQFQRRDFDRLERQYGVTWAVLRQPGHADLDCPYQNTAVKVCRLP
jgi:hypothetical protein